MTTKHTSDCRRQLLTLLQDLPRWLGGPPATRLDSRADLLLPERLAIELGIGNERLTVTHANAGEAAVLAVVECRLGMVPPIGRTAILARMLACNFRLSASRPSAFALDAATGEVLHAFVCIIDETQPERFAATLARIGSLVPWWRQQVFPSVLKQLHD